MRIRGRLNLRREIRLEGVIGPIEMEGKTKRVLRWRLDHIELSRAGGVGEQIQNSKEQEKI